MPTYRANWRLRGALGIKVLLPGQTVTLSAADAARFVSRGVLSPCAAGEGNNVAPPPADPPVDLSAMTKAQLVEYGRAQLGLSLDGAKTKADLLAAIAAAAGR
jgi:hypothetical protein